MQSELNASSLVSCSWWKDKGRSFLQLHSWVKQPLWVCNDLSFPHSWRPTLLQHPCKRPFLLIALRLCISCIPSANENSFLVTPPGERQFPPSPHPYLYIWSSDLLDISVLWQIYMKHLPLLVGLGILQGKTAGCLRSISASPCPDD